MVAFQRTPSGHWVGGTAEREPWVALIAASDAWSARTAELLARDGIASVERRRPGPDALDALGADVDVVVLDYRGAAADPAWVRRLRRRLPGAALIVVVPPAQEPGVRGAVAAGVDGLVGERELDVGLGPIVRAVCAGQICVPQRMRYLIEPPALSHREKQVLALVIAGRANAEIARRLCLGESTVKAHLSSAFRRLGVRSRREAAAAVLHSDERLRDGVLMTLRATDPGFRARTP